MTFVVLTQVCVKLGKQLNSAGVSIGCQLSQEHVIQLAYLLLQVGCAVHRYHSGFCAMRSAMRARTSASASAVGV